MTSTADVFAVAGSQLGYVEGPNNQNKFGAWYGVDHAPWCAEFVSWVLYTAFHAGGQASPLEGVQNAKGAAYCPFVVNWAKRTARWTAHPAPGSLVLFDWNHDGTADHIGICVTGEDAAGNFATIEGNTAPANNANGGEVMRRTRSNRAGYCLGFVTIDYAGTHAAPPPVSPTTPGPAAPGGAPAWQRNLALSSPLTHGGDVLVLQAQLAARGWHLGVDGVYGPETERTVCAFQRDKHLAVDGVCGPVTWHAVFTAPIT